MKLTTPILSARNLAAKRSWRTVFDDLTLDIMPGERLFIYGENGCGKSTLLETLLCLHPSSVGEVLWYGQPLSRVRDTAMLDGRIVFLRQHHNVFQSLTVRENIMIGCRLDKAAAAQRLNRVLDVIPELGQVLDFKPNQVSSGQRQLTACFRVMMRTPELLVLDEPSAGLGRHLIGPLYTLFENSLAATSAIIFTEQKTTQAFARATQSLLLKTGEIHSSSKVSDHNRDASATPV